MANLVYVASYLHIIFLTSWCILTKLAYGPHRKKTCLLGFANNTGADQPAHPRSLFSSYVIRFLESIISRLAMSEILIF